MKLNTYFVINEKLMHMHQQCTWPFAT